MCAELRVEQVAVGQAGAKLARVAVLVDGENVSHLLATEILLGAGRSGKVTVRRVYGDVALLRGWEADTRFSARHTGHGRSKNTADINLVIEAMDLAHDRLVDAFVIVSSDGDFAPLATRLREASFGVTGIGMPRAAQSFKDACTEFQPILAEVTQLSGPEGEAPRPEIQKARPSKPALSKVDAAIHRLCHKHGGSAAKVPLTELGIKMPQEESINRKDTHCASWRSYLSRHPDLYILEGKGQVGTVRLKNP